MDVDGFMKEIEEEARQTVERLNKEKDDYIEKMEPIMKEIEEEANKKING